MTQTEQVLAVLRDGRPHTARELYTLAGTLRASARVLELRRAGWPIVTEWVDVDGRRRPAYRLAGLRYDVAALEQAAELEHELTLAEAALS